MDVLYFLKSNHDTIRADLAGLKQDGGKDRQQTVKSLARHLDVHLLLQRDYLYPEIADLFTGSETLVAIGLAEATAISKHLKTLVKLSAKPLDEQADFATAHAELTDAVLKHLDHEEQLMMPKIRSAMRTEDREDLGQVFEDFSTEALAAAAVGVVKAATEASPSRSRKRA